MVLEEIWGQVVSQLLAVPLVLPVWAQQQLAKLSTHFLRAPLMTLFHLIMATHTPLNFTNTSHYSI